MSGYGAYLIILGVTAVGCFGFTFLVRRMALRLKPRCHPPRTVEGSLQVLAIDERHQFQFVGAGLDRPIVECGAAQPQKFALPAE